MKRMIDPLEHATEILQGVQKGVLLTTKHGDRVNSMTISWGTLGIEWGKPLFTAFVRQHRFTKEFLEATGEFSVNISVGEFDKNIIALCGSKSGRDMDKIAELGLTLEDPEVVAAPGIRELPLTLECKFAMCRTKIYARSIQVILSAGTQPTKLVSAISIRYSAAKSLRHTLSSSL